MAARKQRPLVSAQALLRRNITIRPYLLRNEVTALATVHHKALRFGVGTPVIKSSRPIRDGLRLAAQILDGQRPDADFCLFELYALPRDVIRTVVNVCCYLDGVPDGVRGKLLTVYLYE